MLEHLKRKSVWLQEADERYATLTGRIRVLEGKLLTNSQLENLMQISDDASFLHTLAEHSYPQGNHVLDILAMERLRVASFVAKNSLDIFVSELLLLDRVYHNMVVFLKYALTKENGFDGKTIPPDLGALLFPLSLSTVKQDPGEAYMMGEKRVRDLVLDDHQVKKLWEHVLYTVEKYQEVRSAHDFFERWLLSIPTHNFNEMTVEDWQNAAENESFFWHHLSTGEQNDWLGFSLDESIGVSRFLEMPRFYTFALAQGIGAYRDTKNIGAVSNAMYQVFYMHLHTLAHVGRQGILLEYACLKSQLALMQTLARAVRLDFTENQVLAAWVPGGIYDQKSFLEEYRTKKNQAEKATLNTNGENKNALSIAAYEDEVWHLWMKKSLDSLYGPSVLMAYYIAKLREIKNIRMIYQLKREGFLAEKIRNFIRKGLLDG